MISPHGFKPAQSTCHRLSHWPSCQGSSLRNQETKLQSTVDVPTVTCEIDLSCLRCHLFCTAHSHEQLGILKVRERWAVVPESHVVLQLVSCVCGDWLPLLCGEECVLVLTLFDLFSVYRTTPEFWCFLSLKGDSGLSISFSLVTNRNMNKTC